MRKLPPGKTHNTENGHRFNDSRRAGMAGKSGRQWPSELADAPAWLLDDLGLPASAAGPETSGALPWTFLVRRLG